MITKPINSSDEDWNFLLFVHGDLSGFKYFYEVMNEPLFVSAFDITRNSEASDLIVTDIFIVAWMLHEKMEGAQQLKDFIRQGVDWRAKAYLETKKVKMISSALTEYENLVAAMFQAWKWRNIEPDTNREQYFNAS